MWLQVASGESRVDRGLVCSVVRRELEFKVLVKGVVTAVSPIELTSDLKSTFFVMEVWWHCVPMPNSVRRRSNSSRCVKVWLIECRIKPRGSELLQEFQKVLTGKINKGTLEGRLSY